MERRQAAYQNLVDGAFSNDNDNLPLDLHSTPTTLGRPYAGAAKAVRAVYSPRSDRSSKTPSPFLELAAHRSLSSVSVTLANLSTEERNFLVLVEDGHVSAVERFLRNHPNTNVNCRDIHGVGALRRAVRNENFQMIGFLLGISHLYVGDNLLNAIELGNTEVVTLLLEGLRERDEQLEFKPVPDSSDYTADISPLMLAAHLDNFNMVKLLVDRGHKLVRPHPPGCLCGRLECSGSKGTLMALLEYSKHRYNAYRALCSPAYITLSSRDVLKTCFKLCGELANCASKEPELLQKYSDLEERLRIFAKAILEECSTTDEVELILKQPHQGAPVGCTYPRIYLAIQCRQKEFIAHENCQQVLRAAWLDHWQDWRGMSFFAKLFRIVTKIGLFPVVTALYLVMPHPPVFVERYMRPPIHRYIVSTTFYLMFLLMLFIETNHDRDNAYRGAPRSGLEIIIVLYIVGNCWEFSKTWQNQGSKTFLAVWWNFYEALNLALFFTTFSIWYWAFWKARNSPRVPRMEWPWNEPVLIAEGLFGFATILAFGRLLQIFRVYEVAKGKTLSRKI